MNRSRIVRAAVLPAVAAALAAGAPAESPKRVSFSHIGLQSVGGSQAIHSFQRYSFGLGALARPQAGRGEGVLWRSLEGLGALGISRRSAAQRTGLSATPPPASPSRRLYQPPPEKVAHPVVGARRPGASDFTPAAAALAYLAAISPAHASALAGADRPVTSLAGEQPGPYRDHMLAAEAAFREGDYAAAAAAYRRANDLTGRDPESLIGLLHATFAMARGGYARPAFYLAQALRYLPELPLAPLEPQAFWPDEAAYAEQVSRLRADAAAEAATAEAHLVAAYFAWFEGDAEQARLALSATLAAARAAEVIEAAETFRDGMDLAEEAAAGEAAPTTGPAPEVP